MRGLTFHRPKDLHIASPEHMKRNVSNNYITAGLKQVAPKYTTNENKANNKSITKTSKNTDFFFVWSYTFDKEGPKNEN